MKRLVQEQGNQQAGNFENLYGENIFTSFMEAVVNPQQPVREDENPDASSRESNGEPLEVANGESNSLLAATTGLSKSRSQLVATSASILEKVFQARNPLVYKSFLCFYVREELPVLSYLYRYRSDIYWEREFELGKFKVFHYFIGPRYRLKYGDLLFYAQEEHHAEPTVKQELDILYEDDILLVLNKHAPLPCHPSGAYFYHSLTKLFQVRGIHCHLIHRLDMETSGVLLAVKHAEDVSAFSQALGKGQKAYQVLVYGSFPDELRVEFPLGPCTGSFVRKKQGRADVYGKPSLTVFKKSREYHWQDEVYSLVTARPVTGRTHQIRAHLFESGFPVVGDKIYGKDERYFLRFLQEGLTPTLLTRLELSRQFLHAERITLVHPITKKEMTFEVSFDKSLELNDFFTFRNWEVL